MKRALTAAALLVFAVSAHAAWLDCQQIGRMGGAIAASRDKGRTENQTLDIIHGTVDMPSVAYFDHGLALTIYRDPEYILMPPEVIEQRVMQDCFDHYYAVRKSMSGG